MVERNISQTAATDLISLLSKCPYRERDGVVGNRTTERTIQIVLALPLTRKEPRLDQVLLSVSGHGHQNSMERSGSQLRMPWMLTDFQTSALCLTCFSSYSRVGGY